MEMAFFYWFSWISWIIVTFLWRKSKRQLIVSRVILVLIICANLYISILSYEVNVSYLLLLIISIYLMTKVNKKKIFLYLIVSLCIVALSTGVRLFFLYDPVIIMFHPAWMLSIIIFLCIIFLFKDAQFRIPIFLISMCLSEFIYTLFLSNIHGAQKMGDPFFLNTTMITIFFLYLWELFESITLKLSLSVKNSTIGR